MKGKILQVCAIDLTVDKLLKPLILESNKSGFETHVACTDTGLFSKLKSDVPNMHNIRIDRSINLVSNIKSIISLYKLIRREKYDIVHVHTPIAALLGRVAAKLAGVKHIVYTAHGFYFHDDMSKKEYKFFYTIEKYAAKFLTDWLLLQSEEDYNLAIKDRFIKEDKTIHLSNGVDLIEVFNPQKLNKDDISNLTEEIGVNENDVIFTFIGRLVREKGIIELLKSFKEISSKYPNAKLLLVGGLPDSERDTTSINEIKELMEQDNVIFLGFRDDIHNLLALSDIFVLPSYREGLPRSIIEAMAMNNAIIATNIRGCREQVVEGENGFLVERKSIKELADAMNKMLSQTDQIENMGLRAREIAVHKFNEAKVLEKQLILFEKLMFGKNFKS
ncbi:glycosyltransferase family 4 protein [Oceanobacillus rekensis]|uniref:glycosyltransferase family 4 protein n=1 Tax=Oceanobacillus rekensis TaxID=937927 RepID=UPI000B444635|nr:glycosyltransferase family 4 protein [Oceanobacillus rekensis]